MLAPAPLKITTMLDTALASQRLSHAVILSGIEGAGRTATAHALSTDLLCLDTTTVKACGSCNSCRGLQKRGHLDADLIHPDLHLLAPDGATIKVDAVRESIEKAWISPLLSHNKVFIIFDAHRMGAEGSNALLKTLEEPPAHTFFILITTSERALLQTIRSRCQSFCFPPPQQAVQSSRDQQRAQELFRERNFDGLRQVLIKGSQLSKKSVTAAQRREHVGDFTNVLFRAISSDIRTADYAQTTSLLKAQDALMETKKELRANVNLTLVINALCIRLEHTILEESPL